ncbi:CMRF35-like molecule 8 [Colossoma macropomum]|uniref:CMRF35-like molecule 8 n=1 Tax=Colossoma macropomum TaxID=42526 RepID=UPI0018642C14|nr:CMRF35-like molecule 8 [Colossoma macropomum]
MLLTFYLLFIGLRVSEGCTLLNSERLLDITAYTGGSVLLPCYCTDLHTTPEGFSWKKDHRYTHTRDKISSESGQYRNRVQLFNGHSPGNLSLLISHLTGEDGGYYWCAVKDAHLVIRLTLQEGPPKSTTPTAVVNVHTSSTTQPYQKPDEGPPKPTTSTAVVNVHTSPTTSRTHSSQGTNNTGDSMHFFILIPVLILLLGLGGAIYCRYRGWSREQTRTNTEQKKQDEVVYCNVVTPTTTTTVTDIEEKAEYATIRRCSNLEDYTESVTGYISECIDDVTVSKLITTHPNQKPWMTAEVHMLLRTHDKAFKSGDKAGLRTARAKISQAIRGADRVYTKKIH